MVRKSAQLGIMFLALLLFVATMGVGLALVGQVWRTNVQHEKEEDLLYVGKAFQKAIGQYYEAPALTKQYPKKLSDLVLDARFNPTPKRYLRKIYIDPMMNEANWGLVKSADGGIMGVYSLSTQVPLRKSSTLSNQITLAKREGYSAWTFTSTSKAAANVTDNTNQKQSETLSNSSTSQPVPAKVIPTGADTSIDIYEAPKR